jgi:hypothetical protein
MASKLREAFRTFSESAKPILNLMDDIDAGASLAMRSGIVRAKHEAIRSASVVLLSGFLESFLRKCAEVFFDELVRRNLGYSQLPEAMRQHHFVAGLDEVRKIARIDKSDSSRTFERTIASIGRLVNAPNSQLSALYWEAFAITNGNPGPEVVSEYLRKFAIKDPMKRIAAAVNTTEPLLRLKLTSFIALRNECAHTGRAKSTPQPSEVKDFVHLLRLLTLAITKVLDKQVAHLCAVGVTPAA